MSEMIERLHKKLHHRLFEDPVNDLVTVVRELIAEMREPTEEMLKAADGPWADDDRPALITEYKAMIDAALEEK